MKQFTLSSKRSKLLVIGITLLTMLDTNLLSFNNAKNLFGFSLQVEAQTTDKNIDAKLFIEGAREKYQQGNYKGALSDCNEAIRLSPNYANAYNCRGNARSKLGDRRGSLSDYNEAIRLDPKYAFAFRNRGLANFKLGNYQGALSDYSKAILLNPKYTEAYIGRGNTRSNLGDKYGAISDYTEAIRDYQEIIDPAA
jgi:tetratricopeptide (TPR) repeat protein